MRIKAKEAIVRTASVDVRVLTLDGKQVTLAVFRQLQQESLIDTVTLQFRGVPWGKVNYYFGSCQPDRHLHVVWQLGDELRRDCGQVPAGFCEWMDEHALYLVAW